MQVQDVDWPDASFRWDDDFDGAWDGDFEPGDTRTLAVDPTTGRIAVRVEFGDAGWRVGGAAITAEAPASCFDDGGSGGSSGSEGTGSEGASTDDAATLTDGEPGADSSGGTPAADGDGSGCGCTQTPARPGGWAWLLVLAWRRRRRA